LVRTEDLVHDVHGTIEATEEQLQVTIVGISLQDQIGGREARLSSPEVHGVGVVAREGDTRRFTSDRPGVGVFRSRLDDLPDVEVHGPTDEDLD